MLDRYDENLILSYLEGELDAKASAQFEKLIAQDEPMRLLVEQLVNDRLMLRSVPAKEAPAQLMAHVHEALERQMLMDVGAAGRSKATGPVLYRFRAWHRWAGAVAAVVALGAGLTWHFDPFGWSSSSTLITPQPIGELASNLPAPKTGPVMTNPQVADAAAKSRQTPETVATRPQTNDDANVPPPPVAAMAAANNNDNKKFAGETTGQADALGGAAAPGGKGTAALALAQESKAVPFDANRAADADTAPAAKTATAGPAFQIELQTASAADTRQLVLAWAADNEAFESPRAERRRQSATFAAANSAARGGADPLRDTAPAADGEAKKYEAAKDRAAGSPTDDGRGAVKPAAAAPSDAVESPVPPSIAADKKNNPTEKAADETDAQEKLKETAKSGSPGVIADAATIKEEGAAARPSAALATLPTRQEITLLVPADRVDDLVELLEARTGQSLLVVREGDQTLLLSPQVANTRALKRTESLAKKAAHEQSEKIAAPLVEKTQPSGAAATEAGPAIAAAPPAPAVKSDGATSPAVISPASPARPAPAPGASPAATKPGIAAPSALKDEAPAKAEKQSAPLQATRKDAAKEGDQVVVRIVIVEDSK